LFKWILYIRKLFANDDAVFEKTIKDAITILFMVYPHKKPSYSENDQDNINKEGLSPSIDSINNENLSISSKFEFSLLSHLVRYESYDNLHVLHYFLFNIVNEIYNEEHELIMTCKEIENYHFNGNFNYKPLLKLMLISFTPIKVSKELKRKCFKNENYSEFLPESTFTNSLLKLYSGNYSSSQEIATLEFVIVRYMSNSTINFFLNNQLRFRVSTNYWLVSILKKMDKMGLLSLKGLPIKNMFTFFKFGSPEWRWDGDRYIELLNQGRCANILSQEEYDKYCNLILSPSPITFN